MLDFKLRFKIKILKLLIYVIQFMSARENFSQDQNDRLKSA